MFQHPPSSSDHTSSTTGATAHTAPDTSGVKLPKIRWFYDVIQQHLRALKDMKKEPIGFFITSLLEIKLD